MAAGGKNPATPFVGGTSVFPNTDLTATPGSAAATVEWTDVVDTPTTVAGYGITDAMDLESNQTAAGEKTFTTSPIAPGMTGNDATGGLLFEDQSAAGDGIGIASDHGAIQIIAETNVITQALSASYIAVAGVDMGWQAGNDISLRAGVKTTITAPEIDLVASTLVDASSSAEVLVPTPSPGDNSNKAASTAFVDTAIAAIPSSPVTSVFGRTGAVVAASGDYTVAEVTGAAPLASPALTGTPTAPTQTVGDNTTKIATDAFVQAAIAASGFLPESGGTMTGIIKVAGVEYTVTLVNDANYTLTNADDIVVWTVITAVRFLVINSGLATGKRVEVRDASGSIVAGTKEIQLSFGAGVTGNGNTGCCFGLINQPLGVGVVLSYNTNTWHYAGNSWPLALPSSSSVTYNGGATIGGNWVYKATSGFAISILSGSSVGIQNTSTTISGTLTLTNASSNFQAINGGSADRIVNLPFTNGNFFWIWNTGTTNNLLVTANSALVYSLPPGRAALFAFNGAAFQAYEGSAAKLRFTKDLTAQAAAQSAVTLDTAPSNGAGMYRVSWSAVITQASDGTSSLGGTNGFQVTYTDNDTGASATTPVGAVSAANAVGTQLNGTTLVNAKVSTVITFSFDYASVFTTTTMKYALHVRSEYLG